MILEHRAYTMKPGLSERFYETQIERGFDIVRPIMERLIGYFTTVSGPTDQVVHLYAFDSLEDWHDRLHGLYGLPELESYFPKVRPLMLAQENHILLPAPLPALTPHFSVGSYWTPDDAPLADPAELRNIVVEEEITSLTPGALDKYWELIELHGIPAMTPLETNRIGCFSMMVGALHQVYHYWFFDGHDDRTRRHNAVHMNPDWVTFQKEVRPIVVKRASKLMVPAPVPEMMPLFRSVGP